MFRIGKTFWSRLSIALGLMAGAIALPAHAGLITFSSDATGTVENGFQSVDAPGVHFSAIAFTHFNISPFEGNLQPAAVSFSEGFRIEFDFLIGSVSMQLGNDDTCCGSLGDVATLTAFLDAAPVGTASLALNFNDVMDQTISLAGVVFDSVTIQYLNPSGMPIVAAVVIDNIAFADAIIAVPEPGTLPLLFASALAFLLVRHRRLAPRK